MRHRTIEHVLQQYHLSLTQPRVQIYEVLARSEPLTMQELIAALPDMHKTTVYRTIELFEQHGVVQRLQIGFKYKLELTNTYQEHHHHITCVSCGKTVALTESDIIEAQLTGLARQAGFTPEDHQIELTGRCQQCSET